MSPSCPTLMESRLPPGPSGVSPEVPGLPMDSIHEDLTPALLEKAALKSEEAIDTGDSTDDSHPTGESTSVYLVDWDGPNDSENPRKYVNCTLLS